MKRKSILCYLLILLLLFSGVSFTAADEPEDPQAAPAAGERVNFLIAGIDHRSNGSTTSGTQVHADTIIVVSVDFENNLVDLISLPRDMLVRVPGHRGYYKINAAFNVGGGMDDPDGGFMAVADTAGEVLGGISIPYYFAVDLSSMKALVDAIGGVDIEVEQSFTAGGKKYEAGFQHLDGTAAVAYSRLRKSATVGRNDIGRTSRQRQVLLALYKKVRNEGIISSLPSVIMSFKDGIWTNISFTQMATLANFALNFEPDNVGMHSLSGAIKIHSGWAYHFIDQAARKELILSVYGFEADPYGIDSENYAQYLDDTGFTGMKVLAQTEKVFSALEEQIMGGTPATDEQVRLYYDAYTSYQAFYEAFEALDAFMIGYPDGVPRENRAELKTLKETFASAQKACRKAAVALGKTLGFKDTDFTWAVWPVFYKDTDINEVFVDFN